MKWASLARSALQPANHFTFFVTLYLVLGSGEEQIQAMIAVQKIASAVALDRVGREQGGGVQAGAWRAGPCGRRQGPACQVCDANEVIVQRVRAVVNVVPLLQHGSQGLDVLIEGGCA